MGTLTLNDITLSYFLLPLRLFYTSIPKDKTPAPEALVGLKDWVEAQLGTVLRQAVAGRLDVPRLPDGMLHVREDFTLDTEHLPVSMTLAQVKEEKREGG